jgi:hypothetical protein
MIAKARQLIGTLLLLSESINTYRPGAASLKQEGYA